MATIEDYFKTTITGLDQTSNLQFYKADTFPTINPIHWLVSHFAVGSYSPLGKLNGMLTAHMTQIAPRNGFGWHPHRGLEIYTYVVEGQLYHEDTTGGSGVITAGEVQRMFSGQYIEHQELNLTDHYTRVIQIWFLTRPELWDIEPHYEQVSLEKMPPRQVGDGVVREIIGPNRNTQAHVSVRLTSTLTPAGGQTTVELPQAGEDLFLYIVDGAGQLESTGLHQDFGRYDVILATPQAEAPLLKAGDKPVNFLSFYLEPFVPVKKV
ncbi:MAG TPA: pirin family protein [Anaerolineae bacterium]|nr:pirin family protein [Anaerolineae bacterium]HRV95531.1 pirin family protein [Anaerolineae bacterium]